MPSSARNVSILIDGNGAVFGGSTSTQIREFSELGDTVDLATLAPSNLHTRMYSGNDIVTLSNVPTGGFSNKVNGNRGDDQFTPQAGSTTRDFILGGNDNDRIDLTASTGGADWLNGNSGIDTIIGGTNGGVGLSVLRGGAGADTITVNAGDTHIVVGDLGSDVIQLNGLGRVVLRTDGENASPNRAEADRIVNFVSPADKIYIPGINSTADLSTVEVAGNTFLQASSFTNGTVGLRTIARFDGVTKPVLDAAIPSFIVGATADNALAALTPSNFLNNPTLSNIFV